jgi:hypothetical protein
MLQNKQIFFTHSALNLWEIYSIIRVKYGQLFPNPVLKEEMKPATELQSTALRFEEWR